VKELHVELVIFNDQNRLSHRPARSRSLRCRRPPSLPAESLYESMPMINPWRKATVVPQDPTRSSGVDAEMVAINALRFLAGREEELGRFLALSGVAPADLRRLAGDGAFLGGVLDFLLGDEALLLTFAEEAGIQPEAIAVARRQLDGRQDPLDSGQY
jgi:hypothetical protein